MRFIKFFILFEETSGKTFLASPRMTTTTTRPALTISGERSAPPARYSIRYLAMRGFGGLCGVMGMGMRMMVSMRGRRFAEPGVRRRRKVGVTAATAATTAAASAAASAAAAASARLVTQIRRWSWHHAARSPWNHTVCVSRKLVTLALE